MTACPASSSGAGPDAMRLHRLTLSTLLLAVLLTGLSSACSEMRNGTGMVSQRLGDAVREPGAREVDLGKLTSFGWAYMHVSRPGVTREEICAWIRAKRNDCGRIIRIEKAPDDHVYLLFGQGGRLTHVELHALSNGVFDMEMPEGGLPRERAVFRIRRGAGPEGREAVWLEPA